MSFDLKANIDSMIHTIKEHIVHISTNTIGWIAIVLVHAATIPTLIAVLSGYETRIPVDYILLVYAGVFMFFVKATISKDLLNIITIGLGFFIQACIMALIVFK